MRTSTSPLRNSLTGVRQSNISPLRSSFTGVAGTNVVANPYASYVPATTNMRSSLTNVQSPIQQVYASNVRASYANQPTIVQAPQYVEQIIQQPVSRVVEQIVEAPAQIQYIEQAPQVIEKIVQIPGEVQYVDKIVEKVVPQVEIQEKIVEVERVIERIERVERLDPNITWVDKVVEVPVERIIEVQGPPRYIEHEVEVPIHKTKQIHVPVDVHHEETVEHYDETEINALQSRLQSLKYQCESQGIDWQSALNMSAKNPVERRKVTVPAKQGATVSGQGMIGSQLVGSQSNLSASRSVKKSTKEVGRSYGNPVHVGTSSNTGGGFGGYLSNQ